MNQYSQNPKHDAGLQVNQARHCANCITKSLRKQEWHEDDNKLYLKGVFYNPNVAFLIPEPLLIKWESKLTYRQNQDYDYLVGHEPKTLLPFTSDGKGGYRRNQAAGTASTSLLSLANFLYKEGQLEYGEIVKLHWIFVSLSDESLTLGSQDPKISILAKTG